MKKLTVSLILPCYNEAEHFTVSYERILATLKKSRLGFEILFVEDRSTDATWEVIQEFIKTHRGEIVRAIRHPRNFGRGQSVNDGIREARGEVVGFIDIDCEVSPEYIPRFVAKVQEGWDVVCGHRFYEVSPIGFIRALSSKLYAFFVRLLLSTRQPDTEAGFKFFNRRKILPLLSQIKDKGWFWDTEVMVRSERAGLKIASIPVKFERRSDKTSTVDLWSDTIKYIKNLWRFRTELAADNDKEWEINHYWSVRSPAFSHHYNTFFGVPLTPVGIFLARRYTLISDILRRLPGKTFLDVGCGSGIFMVEAVREGRLAIGVDYSPQMLAQAKENLSHLPGSHYRLIESDSTNIPLNRRTIDVVLASGLTDYLKYEQTEKFMYEVRRLLKPGGWAIITFPKSDSPFRFIREGIGLALRKHVLNLPAMVTSYSKNEIEELLSEAQLVPVTWQDVLGTMRVVLAQKK